MCAMIIIGDHGKMAATGVFSLLFMTLSAQSVSPTAHGWKYNCGAPVVHQQGHGNFRGMDFGYTGQKRASIRLEMPPFTQLFCCRHAPMPGSITISMMRMGLSGRSCSIENLPDTALIISDTIIHARQDKSSTDSVFDFNHERSFQHPHAAISFRNRPYLLSANL